MQFLAITACLLAAASLPAQQTGPAATEAGYTPLISGGMGYVHNVDGGITSLEPQINPVLLVPIGPHVLLESRVDFTGFFQRQHLTSGPFTGKVFKTVEFAQVDWLANTHLIATAGRYSLPFGLYNERLEPLWIRNLQDSPITAEIGTRTSGSGDGVMFRGVLSETQAYSIQYTSYFSLRSNINELQSARVAGGDASIFLHNPRLEIGTSYQRFLQQHEINSVATYLSWQPRQLPLDIKFEYDHSYNGHGYWLEGAYLLRQSSVVPAFLKPLQLVGRIQQSAPFHGGGNGVPVSPEQRVDVGLNYYIHDNLRLISSYGRQFISRDNANVWNAGFTYRFMIPIGPWRNR
jgi:hypothetical protein